LFLVKEIRLFCVDEVGFLVKEIRLVCLNEAGLIEWSGSYKAKLVTGTQIHGGKGKGERSREYGDVYCHSASGRSKGKA
jgi:hypothetical protein